MCNKSITSRRNVLEARKLQIQNSDLFTADEKAKLLKAVDLQIDELIVPDL